MSILDDISKHAKDRAAASRFHAHRINDKLRFASECHFAKEIVLANKKLQQASKGSVLNCINDVAYLGLTLQPSRKQAYLIPRENKKRGVIICTLYTSFIGLQVAAKRWGGLKDMSSHVVYSNEPFTIFAGTSPRVEHQIIANHALRGDFLGAYCHSIMVSGMHKIEYMDRQEIQRAQSYSESKDSPYSPWRTWPEEMARKTVIRRASKAWQSEATEEWGKSLAIQQKYEGRSEERKGAFANMTDIELLTDEHYKQLHSRLLEQELDADRVLRRVARALQVDNMGQLADQRFDEAQKLVEMAVNAKARTDRK